MVGVEMAQVFVRFGVHVTLVEGGDRILVTRPPAHVEGLAEQLEQEGLVLRPGSRRRRPAGGAGRMVELSDGTSVTGAEFWSRWVDARRTSGRWVSKRPERSLDDRGAACAGRPVADRRRAFVAGDAPAVCSSRTSPTTRAASPPSGRGRRSEPDLSVVPKVTFTDPEAASVGLTVDEAQEQGIDAFEISRDFASTGKGQTIEVPAAISPRSWIVTASDWSASSQCARAGEPIHEAVLAMKLNAPLSVLADTIHAFPTSARVMGGIFQEADKQLVAARVRLTRRGRTREQTGLRIGSVRRRDVIPVLATRLQVRATSGSPVRR